MFKPTTISAVCFFVLLMGCGQQNALSVSTITFDPNPASIQSGVCISEAQLVLVQGGAVSIISLVASFESSGGDVALFEFSDTELNQQIDSLYVPERGVLTLPLSFDLAAQGVNEDAIASVVILGVGIDGTVEFVGTLECQN